MQKPEIIEADENIDDIGFEDFDPRDCGCWAGESDDDFDYETDHDIGSQPVNVTPSTTAAFNSQNRA